MRCVANFEVASDLSVVADGQVLDICDPRDDFKALIRNIPRSEFTTPFLLSVHIYFVAEALDEARDIPKWRALIASTLKRFPQIDARPVPSFDEAYPFRELTSLNHFACALCQCGAITREEWAVFTKTLGTGYSSAWSDWMDYKFDPVI